MKKYALTILSLLTIVAIFNVPSAHAAITRVQEFSGTDTTFASTVSTSLVTATAGNLVMCVTESDVVAQNGITVIDSKGNTWTRVRSDAIAATLDLETWYSRITTGGASYKVTASDNGGGVDSSIICEEWSGEAASPVDVNQGATDNTGLSGALNSGATSATSQANEVVIGGGATAGAPTYTVGSGYSNMNRVATTFTSLAFESKIVSATGAQTATLTAGAAGSWGMHVATFKELVPAATSFGTFISFN